MKHTWLILLLVVPLAKCIGEIDRPSPSVEALNYPIVDSGQDRSYDNRKEIKFSKEGVDYRGQDAQYASHQPSYQDNGDGTVSDLVTGLMWTKDPGEKKTFKEAVDYADRCAVGNYADWRLPTIKELYSLILFSGIDLDPTSLDASEVRPFIDSVFSFQYGDPLQGERLIDSQFATSTQYVSTTMGGAATMFGVNFADGRIKGYPINGRRGETRFFVLYVRDNSKYGENQFEDNGDGTITDHATGLTWMKEDSGDDLDWPSALAFAESLKLGGHSDWRLPNAKELQSIVDYTRSPDSSDSAAIDPIFETTQILNEGGVVDYGHYWTSTTHVGSRGSNAAICFAFGRSLGFMKDRRTGEYDLQDVHGAGSQRSDPKIGDASKYPHGRGPQGDVIRIQNKVRCVRGGDVSVIEDGPQLEPVSTTIKPEAEGRRSDSRKENRFLRRSDTNGDGRVSRDEFTGPDKHFDRFDQDGDGYISEDEAPTGPPANRKG